MSTRGNRLPTSVGVTTGLFVVWVVFTSFDPVTIDGVGPKVGLLAVALAVWFLNRSGRPIPFTVPVVAVAVGVPIVWLVVATSYPHPYSGLEPSPARMALEHASHFLYLLIYLPLADLTIQRDRTRMALVLVPVLGLCALTWIVYMLHANDMNIGYEYPPRGTALGRVGPLNGIVSFPGEVPVRVFFGNHILLVSAAGIALALALNGQRRAWSIAGLAAVIATLYPAQSRGITLAILIVMATTAVLAVGQGRVWPLALVGLAIAVLLTTTVDTRTAAFLRGERGDLSSQQRVHQAPELIAAFRERPIFGSGLGATLPSGFHRSASEPYSFELGYHQMLFQNGLVGLAVILALPAIAVIRALLAMRALGPRERGWAVAGVAAVMGLLFAGATNQLLASSFGMLALAAALAMCARAVAMARSAGETLHQESRA